MVMLHAFEAGQVPGRTTGDLDLLFDVRTYLGATAEATKRLLAAGFREAAPSPEGVAHRLRKDVVVDVLAPDGLGPRTSKETVAGGRTVQVPGGSQALDRTEIVEVRLGGRAARLPRPSLLGAILLKARAVDAARDEAAKHEADLTFLLGLVPDPRSLASQLRKSERRWLRARDEIAERTHPAWRMSQRPDDAFLALEILCRGT